MFNENECDILIAGGGVGGCAAAMSAASLGMKVIMTEETDWIGGQLTSQITPPDEHEHIESFGSTRRYRVFRNCVRDFYRRNYTLSDRAGTEKYLNPGLAWVSKISHEPKVALRVLEEMLAPAISSGKLKVMKRCKAVSAMVSNETVSTVIIRDIEKNTDKVIHAHYLLDATELGDILKLAGVEYVAGAESQYETGEPHAVSGRAQPDNIQAFTWCFALSYDPLENHVIDKPDQYDFWENYTPRLTPAWSGKMLSWNYSHPITLCPFSLPLFSNDGSLSLWNYRRIFAKENFANTESDEVSIVNWPQNDYFEGSIIDRPDSEIAQHLYSSRQLSLSLLYWMQTKAPRTDGGVGYPGLYLRPDITGTKDGLAKRPYIRESRRIRAEFTVTERHVGAEAGRGQRASEFHDSVGIGSYRIDLHPTTGRNNYIDIPSLKFQIPLGALIPVRIDNLIPACKNIGSTHITNGCYRLHPVEWNIGESAGLLAAFCIVRDVMPRQVRSDNKLLEDFQILLRRQGIELQWPE